MGEFRSIPDAFRPRDTMPRCRRPESPDVTLRAIRSSGSRIIKVDRYTGINKQLVQFGSLGEIVASGRGLPVLSSEKALDSSFKCGKKGAKTFSLQMYQ